MDCLVKTVRSEGYFGMYRGKACTYLNIKKQQDSSGRSSARGLNIGEGKLSVVRLTLIRLPLATLVVLTSTERLHFSCVWMLYIYISQSSCKGEVVKWSHAKYYIHCSIVCNIVLVKTESIYFHYQCITQKRKLSLQRNWRPLSLGLCLCEECLFASVFFILQTWVPWDIEGQPIRRSHAGGKSLNGSYNIALFKTLGSSSCFAIYLFCNLTCQ